MQAHGIPLKSEGEEQSRSCYDSEKRDQCYISRDQRPTRRDTISLINDFAPTLQVSEGNPEVRETYDELEIVVRNISNCDFIIIAGDFNAKTGREWRKYPNNIGKYGKGDIKSNGKELQEFCNRQSLVLTNTPFRQKMEHRCTWESPANRAES